MRRWICLRWRIPTGRQREHVPNTFGVQCTYLDLLRGGRNTNKGHPIDVVARDSDDLVRFRVGGHSPLIMTLDDPNSAQLWREAESHARNAVTALATAVPDDVMIRAALPELRKATAAVQELECRLRRRGSGQCT